MKRLVMIITFIMVSTISFSDSIDTIAHQIATINNRGSISKTDISVKRSKYLVTNIAKHVKENEQQIADSSVKAWQIMEEEYGLKTNVIDILEQMNTLLMSQDLPKNTSYYELLGMFLTLSANQ